MPLGRLARHVATLPKLGKTILTTPTTSLGDPNHKWPDMIFTTRDNATRRPFDVLTPPRARAALAAASDADLATPWKFSFGDHVISDARARSPTATRSSTTSSTTARNSACICA